MVAEKEKQEMIVILIQIKTTDMIVRAGGM
jgi:hypothetical protein